jgi:uncharacterized protein YggE
MVIEQPWGISASGRGSVTTEPDHAVVSLAVNRTGNQPREALDATAAAMAAVRAALREHGVPDEDVTSSRTSVQSTWDGYGPERRFLGHQCRAELTVKVAALESVEPVVVAVVAAGADEIVGVDYATSRSDKLKAEARARAVAAARDKATALASAAGVALGPVVHIEDTDPDGGDRPMMFRLAAAMPGAASDAAAGFAPGRLTVSATVTLGFSISR